MRFSFVSFCSTSELREHFRHVNQSHSSPSRTIFLRPRDTISKFCLQFRRTKMTLKYVGCTSSYWISTRRWQRSAEATGDVDEASAKRDHHEVVEVRYVVLKTFLLRGKIHDGGNRAIQISVVVHPSVAQEAISRKLGHRIRGLRKQPRPPLFRSTIFSDIIEKSEMNLSLRAPNVRQWDR